MSISTIMILQELMSSHGFTYFPGSAGTGSGGTFAVGEFRRGDRRLELHFRRSLGLVSYHLGNLSLPHEEYMWAALGRRGRTHYTGFSDDPLAGFRQLLEDLKDYCAAFLSGSDPISWHNTIAPELLQRRKQDCLDPGTSFKEERLSWSAAYNP